MLPTTLKITLEVALFCYFVIILVCLKYKAIELKYTLLWIFCGLAMAFMLLFPDEFLRFINLIGIEGTMNGLFISFIAFLIMITMSLTSIVSKQTKKIRRLAQQIAILERRMQRLEAQGVKEGLENPTDEAPCGHGEKL